MKTTSMASKKFEDQKNNVYDNSEMRNHSPLRSINPSFNSD